MTLVARGLKLFFGSAFLSSPFSRSLIESQKFYESAYRSFRIILTVYLAFFFFHEHLWNPTPPAWYKSQSILSVLYLSMFDLAVRFKKLTPARAIQIQLWVAVPMLALRIGLVGGLTSPGLLWLIALPYLAHIYGSVRFTGLITLTSILSLPLIHWTSLLHLPAPQVTPVQMIATALTSVFFVCFHSLLKALQQDRVDDLEFRVNRLQSNDYAISTIREMMGAVAHQMNTPLSHFFLSLDQIRSQLSPTQLKDEEIQSYFTRIDLAIDRIAQVNRSLLVITNSVDKNPMESASPRNACLLAIDCFKNTSSHSRLELKFFEPPGGALKAIGIRTASVAQFLWRTLFLVEETIRESETVSPVPPSEKPPSYLAHLSLVQNEANPPTIRVSCQLPPRFLRQESLIETMQFISQSILREELVPLIRIESNALIVELSL